MTASAAPTRAVPASPAALAQRVGQQIEKHRHAFERNQVLVVGAAPVWPYDPVIATREGIRLRVVPCVSALAVWEQVTLDDRTPRVLLTDLDSDDLGTGILSLVFRRKILDMEPWGLIAECFGAQRLDPRLEAETWAGPALIDAMPAGGWPRLVGTVLQRDVALRYLLVERLGLARLGVGPDDVDAPTLLRWSARRATQEPLARLSDGERAGLLDWIGSEFGPAARVLSVLIKTGHGDDALPLGLVCASLWSADDPDSLRAQGRVDQYLGAAHLETAVIQSYAKVATQAVAELLHSAQGQSAEAIAARQLGHKVLDRAEELLLGFAASAAARHSDTLRSGFEHRLGTVAFHLNAAQAADPAGLDAAVVAADAAVEHLASHHLATTYQHRVDRARMALRLVRWLATTPALPSGVAEGIDQHITQGAWVDIALDHVWTGEDAHGELARVYRAVHDRVSERRRQLDRAFADQLATWTATAGASGDMLTVEALLARVVAPAVRDGGRPVLLVVIDGMTASIAADLVEDVTSSGWVEFDPLGGKPHSQNAGRRRGAMAALPTVTSVSRTSLLTGDLRSGDQATERVVFDNHPLWRGRPARLFHKGTMFGDAGEVLHEDLVQALSDAETLVGVVINTVDDALDHGRESADAGWRITNLGPLRTLLDHARYHGRAVIVTSDHGHVLDRNGSLLPAETPVSGRHRTDMAPPREGEVELAGPRVVADNERVVALWDPRLRYLPRRAGYHGGASLAEVTVPVLALLPLGAASPPGWRVLGPQQPSWWSATAGDRAEAPSPVPAAAPVPVRPAKKSNKSAFPSDIAMFELPEQSGPDASTGASAPASGSASLVERVLASEMFAAQHGLTPRKVPLAKIRGALTALVEANGVLPAAMVAERAGEQPARATGFVITLQRIFNVDNFPVLSLTDDGRTVRLDSPLLRQQFGLDKAERGRT